jgi:TPR repeat protein
MYESGKGVPKDTQKASQWMAKAADQGLAEAQYFLAEAQEGCDVSTPFKMQETSLVRSDYEAAFDSNKDGLMITREVSLLW